jgi:hypothetical protein
MSTKFKKAFELKNLMMTAAVGALMLPSLGWSAADGRGHNGPDLAPVSIPVQLDRGIRADHMNEAISVCFAKGDSKRGVVSLNQRLLAQLSGQSVDVIAKGVNFDSTQASEDKQNKTFLPQMRAWETFGAYSKYELLLAGTGHPNEVIPDGVFGFAFVPGFSAPMPSFDGVVLRLAGAFPKVKYSSIVQDSGYDEYGRVNDQYRILRGLSIETDANAYGTSVALYNWLTNRKTTVTVNTVEYVECLKSELQKRAE